MFGVELQETVHIKIFIGELKKWLTISSSEKGSSQHSSG
jgi:hypothetical protein